MFIFQDELTEAAAMAPKVQNQEPKKKPAPLVEEEPAAAADAPVAPGEAGPEPTAAAPEESVPFDELYVTHKALEMLGVLLESSNIKSMNGTLQVLIAHIETLFIEIKALASVGSGPKIRTRMPRAFERAPT